MNRIVPARLALSAQGVPYSEAFDDIYHSAEGGLGQARQVFLAGNDLPQAWRGRTLFTIIETGFGQGLNFLATWQAWRADPARSTRLHFVSVELHPFSRDDLALLHARYPELAPLATELRAQWPALTQGMHRLWLDDGRVVLTLGFGDAAHLLPQIEARVDAIYLDGFAPAKNPGLWQVPLFKALWRLSHADTTLASYTVAGAVRRGLTEAGFAVDKVAGFGGKRQMLRGGTARSLRHAASGPGERSALVIGAGLAGSGVAERLAARGWQVTVFDGAVAPASGASGNHAGLMHPSYSRDDNLLARLTRAGCAATRHQLAALAAHGLVVPHRHGGILQLAKHAGQAEAMAQIASAGNWPQLAFLDPGDPAALPGSSRWGGWWFADGATISPSALCRANLVRHPELVTVRTTAMVASLAATAQGWEARDADGAILGCAAVAILANATAARLLTQAEGLPLADAPRVATVVADDPALPVHALAGDAYLTAALDGWRVAGAAPLANGLAQAQADNLASLAAILPHAAPLEAHVCQSRACARPGAPDRLPLIGQLPLPRQDGACHQLRQIARQPGLYGVLAFGSRGLSWTMLAGELLASQLEGEPLPLARALVEAVDPARFMLRSLRSGHA
ncbi:bifunctional tRNA (5-methylaminomethyl-2-thiouridine)(34)-methyltransferase MnmD/FAD-dependent 5-carboxymethylaminomethyl-2-thiouridine(34) oxidoreductase MnmC [Chitiniphilus purpureus]|uniref:tRNA 5-methylaminomethyl-2-thiouridine biosynthesis bifunctional protein MnmC n=1 Tax=Chitiniphilus purpureus TaxID=2981137 RepID=A0ABY6DLC9_9NEIS|nr:bifunctional tRNA (5-methylaminomethyl-2-thiouridine)(34)-methyltransferase MnmD/FAD-dependent 5-carboxymethylaminomethyl-2-thiouridine(34) oxidoreductase MnmC [Chitiniphilus sp. CD1]UXY14276.1 bifunctional tRNA (5-methylaminomethyl-2-thiouridine)(34)-methyltransferase MnmD/FAD-dependent 5-carboxymethylaminomethyl-2-thiouridine(34) oxidoreductase MnmC [Chitiniphilus sp. CD1]